MGRCFKCEPPSNVPDDEIARHMDREHGIDLDAVVQKWPDGEWVVHDQTLTPDDFEAA